MTGKLASHKAPQRIDTLVDAVLRHAAAQHGPLFDIQRRWTRCVGKALAGHTKPVSLRHGRLIVQVDRPGDAFALNYQRPQLLGKLRDMVEGKVEEIVIRPGGRSVSA